MNNVLGQCPVCSESLEITRLYCRNCDTTIEGHFQIGRLSQLTASQLEFVEIFLKREGKINKVGEELGVSYPTVRGRLREVIEALGYAIEIVEEESGVSEEERKALLEELAEGKLSSEDVLKRLGSQ